MATSRNPIEIFWKGALWETAIVLRTSLGSPVHLLPAWYNQNREELVSIPHVSKYSMDAAWWVSALFALKSISQGAFILVSNSHINQPHGIVAEWAHDFYVRNLFKIDVTIRFIFAFRANKPNFLGHFVILPCFSGQTWTGPNQSFLFPNNPTDVLSP